MNSILWLNFAYEIWLDLRERFSQGDIFRISDLQEEISAFKQDDRSVTDYFTETIMIMTVIRFLKGLHDRFAGVRSQIMLIDPLPTINKAFSMDTVDTCYEKHGYPPGYNSRGRTSRAHNVFDDGAAQFLPSSQSVAPLPSDPCVNLTQEQLQQLLALLPSSNSTSPPHVTNTASSLHQTTSTSAGNTFSFQSHHWIIDTGATDHITHSLSLFASFTPIQPVHITLPNGTKVYARFSGTVIFSDSLYITNVLYVPHFAFNLLFVTKLTATLPCSFTFHKTHCSLQAVWYS
ncbi:hypothetical protein PVK06_001760 [Gossypium arboreum]|uniref:Retrovirus-related Pol polyprotein from transposon TNT 1-94-like beta-barrel domain-containing protein n=1 Tax=Gossypium arboreum TaxID=29729 RepID=A0ABR0R2X9_GOSAR|nr:hypothetical protein PVK06_001760 [Gossypium arboreum]